MINKGKVNVMPAQNARLSEDQIRLVASYVWSLSHPTQSADAK
jgi:cytochrome c oxidase cbb3-type subunit 3